MSWRRPLTVLLSAALAVSLGACSSAESGASGAGDESTGDAAVHVVTTTNVYASIVQEIGGDAVSAQPVITSGAQDPHSYEATARDRLAVQKADLVVLNGGGYDDFMTTLAEASGKNQESVVNAAEVSGLDGADESTAEHEHSTDEHNTDEHGTDEHCTDSQSAEGHEHEHGDFNEHVWYSLDAMRALGNTIAEKLGALAPEHADDFAANANDFVGRIDKLQDRVSAMRPAFNGKTVAETEPVSAYLLEDAGLQNQSPSEFIAAMENQQDVSPALMKSMKDLLDVKVVLALVINSQVSTPQIEQLAAQARSLETPVLSFGETIDGDLSYVEWMGANIEQLAAIRPQN